MVSDRKVCKPAVVTSAGGFEELQLWVTSLQPLPIQAESPYVFCTENGQKLMQLSRNIPDTSQNLDIPPTNAVCKAIVTASGGLQEKEKVALAHFMSHMKDTADMYYRALKRPKAWRHMTLLAKY